MELNPTENVGRMESIRKYSDLIKQIPVYNQSAIIKKDTWERFSNIK